MKDHLRQSAEPKKFILKVEAYKILIKSGNVVNVIKFWNPNLIEPGTFEIWHANLVFIIHEPDHLKTAKKCLLHCLRIIPMTKDSKMHENSGLSGLGSIFKNLKSEDCAKEGFDFWGVFRR